MPREFPHNECNLLPYTPPYYAWLYSTTNKPGIRRREEVISALDTQFKDAGAVHDELPGVLYLSSQDAFVEWEIRTTEDGRETVRYYQTGPASWQAVPIWGFRATIKRRTARFLTGADGYRVNQDNGVAIIGDTPTPKWRWWYEIGRLTAPPSEHVNVRGTNATEDQVTGTDGGQQLPRIESADTGTGAPGSLVGVLFPPKLTRFLALNAYGSGVDPVTEPSVSAIQYTLPQTASNDDVVIVGRTPFSGQAKFAVGPWNAVTLENYEFQPVGWGAVWSTKL